MGVSKNELNDYLYRKIASSIQGVTGKRIKSNRNMELIKISNTEHNRKIDANNKSSMSLAENSFRKKTKDYPNILHSIESCFSNSVSYKKFGDKSYQKLSRTNTDNTYSERYLPGKNCRSLSNRPDNEDNHTGTFKQKSSCPYFNISDESGYIEGSTSTHIESLCLNLSDDENNNVQVKRKDTND